MILKASVHKNPFIGLYMRTNNEITLVPKTVPATVAKAAEEALGTKLVHASISQSNLLGIFCALNSNGCAIPAFTEEAEIRAIRDTGLNVALVSSHYSCGNNILCNDKAALVNPAVPKSEVKLIADALGVEAFTHETLTRVPTVGAINVVTNKGLLAYNEVPEVELRKLERLFGVKGQIGTCNMGVPFNGMGIIANDKGALVGDSTSGFEIQRVYEALFGDSE